MANLTASLAQDNYKSTLSQAYNWAVGTIYVKNTPTVTFPAGKKVFLTINPEKSNMQVVRVSARDSTLKTITVDSIAVNKWSWSAYAQQSHAVGSKVVISIPYAVWEELDTVTTDKLDINGWNGLYYASTAARDTALWANGVPTTDYRMVRAWSTFYNYNLWTAQWESVDTGTPTPTMTTTSLWTAELWTQAENTAGTASGSVWPLVITPNIMATTIQRGERLYAGVSATGNDTYVVAMTPVLAAYTTWMRISFKTDVANTWACTINVNSLGAKSIKTQAWSDPADWFIAATSIVSLMYDWTNFVVQNPPNIATDAEARTGTNTTNPTNPFQLKTYFGWTPIAWTWIVVWKSTTAVSFTWSATPTKKYQRTAHKTWTYTVSFTLSNATGFSSWYWRIYKNWSAFWTTRSVTAWGWPTTYSENLAFTAWDEVQLYMRVDASAQSYCDLFSISCDMPVSSVTTY